MLGYYLSPALQAMHRSSLWFFPLVSVYAALVMPLTYFSLNYPDGLPGLADRTGHAYEMFFGLGLGLVAGYLLGSLRLSILLPLVLAWIGARASHLWWPWSGFSLGFQALFCVMLLAVLVPRLNVAKRWRNRMLVPLLIALGVLPVARDLVAMLTSSWHWHEELSGISLLLFALLMGYIGGRAIAPAAAGEHYKLGYNLKARVQPAIEGALILTLAAASVLLPMGYPRIAALFAGFGGVLVLVRLTRWRLWRIRHRTDVLCLGVGYGWLGAGLLTLAVAILTGGPRLGAMHLVTIGALGTLSTGMMARVVLKRTVGESPPPIGLAIIAGCIAFAAITRFVAELSPAGLRTDFLQFSVAGWSTAYTALTIWLLGSLAHYWRHRETRVRF